MKRIIIVHQWMAGPNGDWRPWIETPINLLKVKSVLPKSTLIISDNDPFGCFEENRKRFSELVTKEVVVHSARHFTTEDGFAQLPIILQELNNLI